MPKLAQRLLYSACLHGFGFAHLDHKAGRSWLLTTLLASFQCIQALPALNHTGSLVCRWMQSACEADPAAGALVFYSLIANNFTRSCKRLGCFIAWEATLIRRQLLLQT